MYKLHSDNVKKYKGKIHTEFKGVVNCGAEGKVKIGRQITKV